MNPSEYFFELPKTTRPEDVVLPEIWYPGIKDFWGKCTIRRIYDPILGVRAIVIHATAGASSAGAVSVMRDGKASFHWLVPDEDEEQHGKIIWACAPEARAAWHVRNDCHIPEMNNDANKINHWSVGVEIVNAQLNDSFSDWQVQITAKIVRYCWAKYPNLQYVVSHAKLDPNRRSDPGKLFPWVKFRKLVLSGVDDGFPVVAMAAPNAAIVASINHDDCCMR